MDSAGTGSAEIADREIIISRVLAAPRALVWEAFTDIRHIGNWWGPDGFRTTTTEHDLRPGGVWRHVMHGPDGVDYPNLAEFIEVVPPERLVYWHGGGRDDLEDVRFHVTVTLTEQQGTTTITMRSLFPTREQLERVIRDYGALEGGKQHLARLAGYLKTMPVAR